MAKVKVKRNTSKAKPKATASNRRTREDIDKLVPAFVRHLKAGGTMKALKGEHGFSSDVPIREALARKGYDSKGAKFVIEPINGTGKTLAGRVAKARQTGTPFYVLAIATGRSEADLKSLLEEHGFKSEASGRIYKPAAPKPAAKPKAKAKAATKSKGKSRPSAKA